MLWVKIIISLISFFSTAFGQVDFLNFKEATEGLGPLSVYASHPDNAIIARFGRLGEGGCNEQVIMFRVVTPKVGIKAFDLTLEDVPLVLQENFCPPSTAKKRSIDTNH